MYYSGGTEIVMSQVSEFILKNFKYTIRCEREDVGNLIGLPYPYTTPCANECFIEMYYWDTYFTNVGLLAMGNISQAKNNTDNIRFLINKYGYMPNGNRTFFLGATQPPFYFKMVEEIFERTGDKGWLSESYAAIAKEYSYWQQNRLATNGLNVYGNKSNFSDDVIERKYNYFKSRFKGFETEDKREMVNCAHTITALTESGWDCSSRFENAGEFYNPIDLNSLLYGLEKAMEKFSLIIGSGETEVWKKRAADRKNKILKFMFDEKSGVFLDWNYKEERLSPVFSVASFYPFFVGISEQCESSVSRLKEKMLTKYGVTACEKGNYPYELQWDYPNIWAPLQYISYIALKKCGYKDLAETIAKTYINLIDSSFAETGNLWEKYSGLDGKVANADYNAPKMMGWTAGVYLFFCKELNIDFPKDICAE